jgi:dCMP deaminase
MSFCLLAAQRSKDPITQVGACVVDRQGNLIGSGYNGMPRGCHDDEFPWGKGSTNTLENKHLYVCHAELNAIANATGTMDGCTIYVTLFPCNECAKLIIQNGITEVVYLTDKHADKPATKASKLMLDSARVKYWHFGSATLPASGTLPECTRTRHARIQGMAGPGAGWRACEVLGKRMGLPGMQTFQIFTRT